MLSHKNIYRLPRESVFNLTDNTGKGQRVEYEFEVSKIIKKEIGK